jgi:hypothetical protein
MTIDRLVTRIDVTSAGETLADGARPADASRPPSATPMDVEQLRRVLRPLVLEIINQELAFQLRSRGL